MKANIKFDYFAKIKIDSAAFIKLLTRDRVEALKQLYFAHVKTFPYSNFEIRHVAFEHPWTFGNRA